MRDELVRHFNRILSKPFDPTWTLTPQTQDEGARVMACPGCQRDVWFDDWMEKHNDLVKCPHCFAYIEMVDTKGNFDPLVVEKPDPEDLLDSHDGMDHKHLPGVAIRR